MPAGISRTRSGWRSIRAATSSQLAPDRSWSERSSGGAAELGAHHAPHRGGAAPHRHGAIGARQVERREHLAHVRRDRGELLPCGRVGAQVDVGEQAGADPERLAPGDPRRRACPSPPRWTSRPRPPPPARPSTPPGSVAAAPTNASRASSSPLSTRICTPAASATAASSSARFGASRTTAVPTRSTADTPRSRASPAWAATTRAASSILSGGITPSARSAFPSRVNALSLVISRNEPARSSATRRRVVLLPTSMQA